MMVWRRAGPGIPISRFSYPSTTPVLGPNLGNEEKQDDLLRKADFQAYMEKFKNEITAEVTAKVAHTVKTMLDNHLTEVARLCPSVSITEKSKSLLSSSASSNATPSSSEDKSPEMTRHELETVAKNLVHHLEKQKATKEKFRKKKPETRLEDNLERYCRQIAALTMSNNYTESNVKKEEHDPSPMAPSPAFPGALPAAASREISKVIAPETSAPMIEETQSVKGDEKTKRSVKGAQVMLDVLSNRLLQNSSLASRNPQETGQTRSNADETAEHTLEKPLSVGALSDKEKAVPMTSSGRPTYHQTQLKSPRAKEERAKTQTNERDHNAVNDWRCASREAPPTYNRYKEEGFLRQTYSMAGRFGRGGNSGFERGAKYSRVRDFGEKGGSDERSRSVQAPPTGKCVTVSGGQQASIFGGAKPVDTRAREKEIEEKLRQREEAKLADGLRRSQDERSSSRGGAEEDESCQNEEEGDLSESGSDVSSIPSGLLVCLEEMGFRDRRRNVHLLKRFDHQLNEVIAELLHTESEGSL